MNISIPEFSRDFNGHVIIIGFGSIGKAFLPLLKRHLNQRKNLVTIISADNSHIEVAEKYGAKFIHLAIDFNNYEGVLTELINKNDEKTFIVNLATEVSSKDLMDFALKNENHYIDTVVEPWPGFYFNPKLSKSEKSNYALRESLSELRIKSKNKTTMISCCGANPGTVSWFVKAALMTMADDLGLEVKKPNSQAEWTKLMQELNIKGIHIAEKDNQTSAQVREDGCFVNTWSVEGCIAECLQPAELGWGTHEIKLPLDGREHDEGPKSSIYLDTPGGAVKVRTWTPTYGKHFGYLITHNESISISEYFTDKNESGYVVFRPTCHYAYHPSNSTVDSIEEMFKQNDGKPLNKTKLLTEYNITEGADELGVLLYGNENGAYWYGSRLTVEEAKYLAPHQNATGMQVASAVLAGIFYALNHPNEGLIEADEMDFEECLNIQEHYLGQVFGVFADWDPSADIKIADNENPWQFSNIRITPPEKFIE